MSWASLPTVKNLVLLYMLKYLWKIDTTFFLSVLVTLVGPLLALCIKQEEDCLFLLIEIIVKVLTSKQLAQIDEVFLCTCLMNWNKQTKTKLVCRTETESNSVKQNVGNHCEWTKLLFKSTPEWLLGEEKLFKTNVHLRSNNYRLIMNRNLKC